MPSFRRRESVVDANRVDEPPQDPDRAVDAAQARALAEEAEAEAAEAEAIATAVRARARALKLRRQAEAAEATATNGRAAVAEEPATEDPDATAEVDAPDVTKSETDTTVDDAASAAEADDTVDAAEAEPAAKPRRWTTGRILKIAAASVAAIVACALITLSVLMVRHHRDVVRDQQRNAEYAAAARQSVVTMMSLDFNKAKEDVQRIIDNSTGQFKDDFQNNAPDFIKVAQDSKVVTDVTVNATAVESMTDNTATVLVSATSRVTNSAGAKQDPRSWRLTVDLKRDGGQLKMSKVEFVP
ncbi:MAG: Mce-associated rane protein [Mycobacterium sp.]|nr:Mce-associated rane protein [Mycobacterium sp.]